MVETDPDIRHQEFMTIDTLPSDHQEDMLILGDSSDNEIGFLSKSECHMGLGRLHLSLIHI